MENPTKLRRNSHPQKVNLRTSIRFGIGMMLAAIVTIAAASAAETPLVVKSPDGKMEVTIQSTDKLCYSLAVDGKPIIRQARLGLRLRGGTEFGREVELLTKTFSSVHTTWENPWGKRRKVRDRHNELRVELSEGSAAGLRFELHVRVFDDGLGFRYLVPKQRGLGSFIVEEEMTEFAFTGDFTCFAGEQPKGFEGSQEWEFKRKQLAELKPESIVGLPLLIKTPATWIAVTESDLIDWSGMWLSGSSRKVDSGVILTTKLAPRKDGLGLVKAVAPHRSPWRVIMIGREPGRLVESDLVINLATPCKLDDTSWIKPGMMAWDHWWTGDVKMDTATVKQYIQLAADMGWPYQLIDWQWYGPFAKPDSDITKVNPKLDLEEVRRFAKDKGVRLWLWLHWADVMRGNAYQKAFPLYQEWGIAGVKIDGVSSNVEDTDDQDMVNLYDLITREAAKHRLMVNYHHAYKPTGTQRTLPNQVTREGILGNEYNRSHENVTPEHKVMLPFTRLLAGPGDYTPGGFVNRQPHQFQIDGKRTQVQGTRAAELALFVIYESPVNCACDHPDHYRDQPGADFLKVVPTVWDDTRVLLGEPGEHILMVRQSGNEWYLGGLTDRMPRTLKAKLDFLGGGSWSIRMWQDAPDSETNAEHIQVVERMVTAADVIDLKLAPSGGVAARLTPVR